MISKSIYVTTTTEFVHQYKDAPDEVEYLRYPHRHLLYIRAEIEVFNEDRELEFIMVKHKVDKFVRDTFSEVTNRSCENLCSMLLSYLQSEYGNDRNISITVSEDNENGAILVYKEGY